MQDKGNITWEIISSAGQGVSFCDQTHSSCLSRKDQQCTTKTTFNPHK